MNDSPEPMPRSEFWMRVAGVCFGIWALMIPIGIGMIRTVFADAASANASLAAALTEYKLATERRLTVLEVSCNRSKE